MSGEINHPESCQVDFYLLGESSPGAAKLACRLTLMALERKQRIFIVTTSDASSKQLDELMWQYPEGRFIPHAIAGEQDSAKAPVNIGTLSGLSPADVVINLCLEAIPQLERFSRLLEIVPYADDEKEASRAKFRIYRNLNLNPQTHEINK
ncbi:MAG: DNA polymerase III subunit chi [Xanthomonadales bacterium]|nr:DNA polymerase III subunit chi [Xanthomonadales bacterium]